MTKADAIEDFREVVLPSIPKGDKVMIRCAWNDYTDALCKSGHITSHQYQNWTNPYDK